MSSPCCAEAAGQIVLGVSATTTSEAQTLCVAYDVDSQRVISQATAGRCIWCAGERGEGGLTHKAFVTR